MLGSVDLLLLPYGTALGIYALWVLLSEGGKALFRHVHSDGSYASASDPRLLFGLGDASAGGEITGLRVRWPDGKAEVFPPPPLGKYSTLRQGEGKAEPAGPAEKPAAPGSPGSPSGTATSAAPTATGAEGSPTP
jgi:hypothetical protein